MKQYDTPSGWFAVANSAELAPGKVLTRTLCGREVVVFRTATGGACVTDARCAHLGAHLGRGGCVEGETLRCPFHGFCFDGSGACVKTGYGTRPPPRARLRAFPVHETEAVVLAWYDAADAAPAWRVPTLDGRGLTRPSIRLFRLVGHPQQTTENSVDLSHFHWVHGFENVQITSPLEIEGPNLRIGYAIQHKMGPAGTFRSEFDVYVHGLGYSRVEARVPMLGMRSRHLVLATPTEPGQLELRITMAVEALDLPSPLRRLLGRWSAGVGRLAARLLQAPMMQVYGRDVAQDIRIWRHQRYEGPTALAAGDGPIGRYRQWAQRFYRVAANP